MTSRPAEDGYSPPEIVRARVVARGVVQGVGFRPFVHRLASAANLHGWVVNSTEGVEIEAEGAEDTVGDFLHSLVMQAPPLAQIQRLDVSYFPPAGYKSFAIRSTSREPAGFTLVSPDIATCSDCLDELSDPHDRRHQYPFINCTNCGPRFTIVQSLPYDRQRTTMVGFSMCARCHGEYIGAESRRFHAQPNACPNCGPSVWLLPPPDRAAATARHAAGGPHSGCIGGRSQGQSESIEQAARLLHAGRIVAIKGLGGFHLACDAGNARAVSTLRARKRRVRKPFALMVGDLAAATKLCNVSTAEARLLSSVRRPIVLLDRLAGAPVAPEVAPNNSRLGLMLPYTPLHHLLLGAAASQGVTALVMTSGNLCEEPIAKENEEALAKLAPVADHFLLHNRPISSRCDDSVTQIVDGKETLLRRSRGYAPLPLQLALDLAPTLACGGQLKNTFCLAQGRQAFLSQHIGDLENEETLDFFVESIDRYKRLFNISPLVFAHDLHPDYLSSRYSLSQAGAHFGVQHHHAHIAACMAESGLSERVIGVAFDGAGYGTDGTIWGGEFLLSDLRGFERAAHLRPMPLPGGAVAIRRPERIALALIGEALDGDREGLDLPLFMPPAERRAVCQQIARSINVPVTSSCGRLLDAVSALLGICREVTYEGQAAIELELAAEDGVVGDYDFACSTARPLVVDWAPLVRSLLADLRAGVRVSAIAAKAQNSIARMIAVVCMTLRASSGLTAVCLSGGVFQNRYILNRALGALRREGFDVHIHHYVPCNDGGISLGQAVVAGERFRAGPADGVSPRPGAFDRRRVHSSG